MNDHRNNNNHNPIDNTATSNESDGVRHVSTATSTCNSSTNTTTSTDHHSSNTSVVAAATTGETPLTATTTTDPSSSSSSVLLPTAATAASPLSVTIITQNILPSYSSERFYLLSELEVHAASTIFLSYNNNSDDDHSTQATEEESLNHYYNNGTTSNASDDDNNNIDNIDDNDPMNLDHDIQEEPNPPDTTTTVNTPPPPPPSFFILYILWKPNMTTDPQLLIQETILNAMAQIQQQYNVDIQQSSKTIEQYRSSTNQSPPPRSSSVSIYIVVDRIVPTKSMVRSTTSSSSDEPNTTDTTTTAVSSSTTTQHSATTESVPNELYATQQQQQEVEDAFEEEQYRLVERFGRAVASHARLRDVIDGITIGRSDHVRAAPGLELCVDAMTKIGNIDRRRYKFNPKNHYKSSSNNNNSSNNNVNISELEAEAKKSLLSIVAMSKGDLLGLQEISNTDAAECVQQSTMTAEWYGQGDIFMFASRAHYIWKQRYNVLIDSEHAMDGTTGFIPTSDPLFRKRKLPRRIAQPNRRDVIMVSDHLTTGGSSSSSRNSTQPQQRYRMTLQQELELLDEIYDILGYVWVIAFILYHFVPFDVTLLISAYDTLTSLIQSIVRMWIDLIRSARGW